MNDGDPALGRAPAIRVRVAEGDIVEAVAVHVARRDDGAAKAFPRVVGGDAEAGAGR